VHLRCLQMRKGELTPLGVSAKRRLPSPFASDSSEMCSGPFSELTIPRAALIVFRRSWRSIIKNLEDFRNKRRNSSLLVPRPELAGVGGTPTHRRSVGHIDLTALRSAKADILSRTAPNNPELLQHRQALPLGCLGSTHGCDLSCQRLHKRSAGPPS